MGWFGTSTQVSSKVTSITLDEGSSKTLWYVNSTSVSDVTFSSDDTSVASVSRGSMGTTYQRKITVRGVGGGSTSISASTGDSLSVTVNSTSSGGGSGGDSGGDDDDDDSGGGSGSGGGGGSDSGTTTSGYWSSDGTVSGKTSSTSVEVGETVKVYFCSGVNITSYTFSSNNTGIASVTGNTSDTIYKRVVTIKGVAEGTTSVVSTNGVSISVRVTAPDYSSVSGYWSTDGTVNNKVSSITIEEGSSKNMYYSAGVDITKMAFSSNDSSVASVTGTYSNTIYKRVVTIKGVSPGTAYVGSTNNDDLTVVVQESSSGGGGSEGTISGYWSKDGTVNTKITSLTMEVEQTTKVYYKAGVDISDMTFSIGDSSIASISASSYTIYGHVIDITTKAAGNTEISTSGGDSLPLTVEESAEEGSPVTAIQMDTTNVSMNPGEAVNIGYKLLPEGATTGNVVKISGSPDQTIAGITLNGSRVRVVGKKAGKTSFYLQTDTAKSSTVSVTVGANSKDFTITYQLASTFARLTRAASETDVVVEEGKSTRLATFAELGESLTGWVDENGNYVGTVKTKMVPTRDITLTPKAVVVEGEEGEGPILQVTYEGEGRIMHLGIVQSIEDTYTASLTRIPTMVFGVDNRFVMDTGVVRRLNVSLERVNPFPYDDDSTDDRDWSNGKWWLMFEKLIDFWQNLGDDYRSLEQVGGMRFKCPSQDEELYPTIESNVFITGNVNPKFGVHKITYTLPMTVARMKSQGSTVNRVKYTFISNIPGQDDLVHVEYYPKSVTIPVPVFPSSWDADGYAFTSWSTTRTGGTVYPAGVRMDTGSAEEVTFYGRWAAPKATLVSTLAGDNTRTDVYGSGISYSDSGLVVAAGSGITRMMALVVGAGGGCGGGVDRITNFNSAGGAGGSGGVVQNTISISPGQRITYTVGKGGRGRPNKNASSGDDGGDGGSSHVSIDGIKMIEAEGGDGGEGAPFWLWAGKEVAGGKGVLPGGSVAPHDGQSIAKGGEGGNGSTASPNVEANVGIGAKPKSYAGVYHAGGAGGAAAALNHTIRVGDTKMTFTSKGGNGTCHGRGKDGIYGGGGGSGSGDVTESDGYAQGDGGDGLIVLVFY